MKIAAFIGDMHQAYAASLVKIIEEYSALNGDTADIFGNCSVPDANPLYAEGLKSIFHVPDYGLYDGILLSSDTLHHFNMNKELISMIKEKATCPVVAVRSEEPSFHSIVPDNEGSMYLITKLILKSGKTDIGFVTGRDDMADAHERLDGFLRAMNEIGQSEQDIRIFQGDYWRHQGAVQADFFLAPTGTASSLPQVIICSNDYMALALIDEFQTRGIRVPEDVWVTGFDNIDEGRDNFPSLTSIDPDIRTMTFEALDMLRALASGEDMPPVKKVPGKVILRKSSIDTSDGHASAAVSEPAFDYLAVEARNRLTTQEYIWLSTLFEDVLSMDDMIKYTERELTRKEGFEECRVCINDEHPVTSDAVTVFLPIHFRNTAYGYCQLKLKHNARKYMDESTEFLLILAGQTISRLKMYEELFAAKDIQRLYLIDPLTNLYNRRGFDRKLSELFEECSRFGGRIAVVSIDMDNLKEINDNYGHSAGDEALIRISSLITSALNSDEFAVRMGGDEFEVILRIDNEGREEEFVRGFRDAIKADNTDPRFKLDASLGICEVSDWEHVIDCMHIADQRMYEEKKAKKCARI